MHKQEGTCIHCSAYVVRVEDGTLTSLLARSPGVRITYRTGEGPTTCPGGEPHQLDDDTDADAS